MGTKDIEHFKQATSSLISIEDLAKEFNLRTNQVVLVLSLLLSKNVIKGKITSGKFFISESELRTTAHQSVKLESDYESKTTPTSKLENEVKNIQVSPLSQYRLRDLSSRPYVPIKPPQKKIGQYHYETSHFNEAPSGKQIARELYNRGREFSKIGRYKEANNEYDKALKYDPRNDYIWRSKGFCLYTLGKLEEALECYSKALKVNPDDKNSLSMINKIKKKLEEENKPEIEQEKGIDRPASESVVYINTCVKCGRKFNTLISKKTKCQSCVAKEMRDAMD